MKKEWQFTRFNSFDELCSWMNFWEYIITVKHIIYVGNNGLVVFYKYYRRIESDEKPVAHIELQKE